MTTRARAWTGAALVTVLAIVLVVVDLADVSIRTWWLDHAFTASVVAGILVLAVTVLIADQVVSARQLKDRSRAMAAQAAIVMSQASRASKAVLSILDGGGGGGDGGDSDSDGDSDGGGNRDGDRGAASEEVQTYMMMLLISAPVLIDGPVSRTFLEDAQRLGGELARALAKVDGSSTRLEQAVAKVRASSAPLLEILRPEQRTAVTSDDLDSGPSGDPGTGPP